MTTDKPIKLPDTSKLIVSSSPHFHASQNVSHIMLLVIAALMPACAAGVYLFGWRALQVLVVCSLGCMAVEACFCKLIGKPLSLRDFSALLTGILLAMNLSASTPWWICLVGCLLAIGLGKCIYGGLGYNPFNPALVARVGLLIAFPGAMTTWVKPEPGKLLSDAVTTATPLGQLGTDNIVGHDYMSYFLGTIGGCIGETSALALLIGGLALILLKIIRWQVPAAFIGTVAVITGLAHLASPETTATPLFHLLTGGLVLGAFFMATDMVTTPMSVKGGIIFGIGCGIITSVIRIWGNYPEGVSFSILFMNALTPLIDRYTGGKPFGARRKEATT